LMVQEFLPSIRQLVTRQLRRQGFSQSKISAMLGITQASVSHYLSSETGRSYSTLAAFGVPREEADTYAALLAEDVKRSTVDGVSTLNTLWTGLLGSGSVCGRHREQYPSLADCDVCIKEYARDQPERSGTIAEVADAVKVLESSATFVNVMPEVSVNIACTASDATSVAEVVAVPGRIVKVRGRAKANLPPEPGASRHLSRVLLLVRRVRPEVCACINLRYDLKVGRILKRLSIRSIQIGGYFLTATGDPTIGALVERLSTTHGTFDAVVDTGGNGIEPNLYLFSTGAREVAALALKIADTYSAR
jgi:predicted fused transcriptional regulator/phosphomethylpyrimidine kinase/predicted transcriptional regulator